MAHLGPAACADHHRRLARALEASGRADPEVLAVHFQGAGEPERGGRYYAPGRRPGGRGPGLRPGRRRSTGWPWNSGRHRRDRGATGSAPRWATPWPTPAAGPRRRRTYLAAAAGRPSAEALELRRRAAMQFLISGHIDEGLDALRTVLGVGRHAPAGHARGGPCCRSCCGGPGCGSAGWGSASATPARSPRPT